MNKEILTWWWDIYYELGRIRRWGQNHYPLTVSELKSLDGKTIACLYEQAWAIKVKLTPELRS